jgi:CubicO group peptidase (beta-lactamase class C family)
MNLKLRNPASMGLDADAIEDAWLSLVTGADRHEYGGAVALVALGDNVVLYRAAGWAVREPESQRSPMGVDAVFDLASITKVAATTPSILRLVASGQIGLDQPVGEILEEFGTEGQKAAVTVRRLLTHSAGFVDWIPAFLDGIGEQFYLDTFAASQPEWEPGTRVLYSDPSFITLGAIIHRVTGETVDTYARREIFEPLGMVDTMFTPPRSLRGRIVGTEIGNDLEAREKVPGKVPANGPWRSSLIRGEVHDGNAWYGFGGVAGHAGLFGTASDLFRYARMWLNGGELDGVRILPEELVAEAIVNHTWFDDPTDVRGLGWRLLPPPGSSEANPDSGRGMSQRAFGHTGFTGTSLWMDPERDLTVILLTNRVHPTVTQDYMETRARFNAAIVDAVSASVAS